LLKYLKMKKLAIKILCIIVVLQLFGCSKSDDYNNVSSEETLVLVPFAPENLNISLQPNKEVLLEWIDKSTNETRFNIYRKIESGNFVKIAEVAKNVNSYIDFDFLIKDKTCTYKVASYNSSGESISFSNEFTILVIDIVTITTAPTIITAPITSISNTAFTGGGEVIVNGNTDNFTIESRGLLCSFNGVFLDIMNPTIIICHHSVEGGTVGAFSSTINGLPVNTTYRVRAYAKIISNNTNTSAIYLGQEVNFTTTNSFENCGNITDIDGNIYPSVTIGSQCWMQENLKVSKYRDGTVIPQVTDPTEWANLTTGAYFYVLSQCNGQQTYEKFYNWYAVNDPRGLAPEGWHIPNNTEWNTLTTFLGGGYNAANAMKNINWTHDTPFHLNHDGIFPMTNSSGFTALQRGVMNSNGTFYENCSGIWWSSIEGNVVNANSFSMFHGWSDPLYNGTRDKRFGLTVRCVKD
jgi:uncharacterized protein (TIGR02145 family)